MGLLDFIFRKKSTTETRTDHIELKIPHTQKKNIITLKKQIFILLNTLTY